MPVLSFSETVSLIDFLIYCRTDHAGGLSLHRKRILHFITVYHGSHTFCLIHIIGIEQIQSGGSLYHMRIYGKRGQQILYPAERSMRGIRHCHTQSLSMFIVTVIIHTGIIHVILIVDLYHTGGPAVFLSRHIQAHAFILPPVQKAVAAVQLRPFRPGRIYVVSAVSGPDHVRIRLSRRRHIARFSLIKFHTLRSLILIFLELLIHL